MPSAHQQQQLGGSVPKDSLGSNGTIINGINGLGINMSSPTIQHHSPPQSVTVVTQVQSAAEKQAAIANEKRRRRRESHNAVERRRRDNINEKISELATLIPECLLDVAGGNAPNLDDQLLSPVSPIDSPTVVLKKEDQDGSTSANGGDAGIVKANKGMILRKSVEYIRYLQQLVTAQGARNRELEQELKMYRSGGSPDVAEPDSSRHLGGDMVLASESATSASNGFNGFTLPPTNEDDELMVEEQGHQHHQHHHHHHHHPYPQPDEEISSPEGSGVSGENENGQATSQQQHDLERGRTRDVVVRRTGSVPGESVLNMNVGMVAAMET
jgi:hypothetical protein